MAALVLLVGWIDYITGPDVSVYTFYLVPITLAAWSIGIGFSLVISVACLAASIASRLASGDDDFQRPGLAAWNSGVQLASFLVLVIVVRRLRKLTDELEARVRDRTASLERSQRDVLRISEREQRRIGQELHDGLCQHLAGAAFTCQSLSDELAEKKRPEAKEAQHVVELVKEAIALSRRSAKGLHPVELSADGLMRALEDFAATTSKLFHVSCRFECDAPVLVHDEAVASNLFRIVQESVRNALTHGQADEIVISLASEEGGLELLVCDNGVGIGNAPRREGGMGLVIMPRRAAMIGAQFSIAKRPERGTMVRCFIPLAAPAGKIIREQESV